MPITCLTLLTYKNKSFSLCINSYTYGYTKIYYFQSAKAEFSAIETQLLSLYLKD